MNTVKLPIPVNALYAIGILEEGNVDLKIAFCDWGTNYRPPSDMARQDSKVRPGSAGSRAVESFEVLYVTTDEEGKVVSVWFNIGNIIVESPPRLHKLAKNEEHSVRYAAIARLHLTVFSPQLSTKGSHNDNVDVLDSDRTAKRVKLEPLQIFCCWWTTI